MGKYSPEEMKKAFIKILAAVERPGITDLLGWLETTDFYTAPASTKYHGAYKGGLLEHSLNVYERLLKLAAGYDLDSIAIVGLLHDLCKAEFYKSPPEIRRMNRANGSRFPAIPSMTSSWRGMVKSPLC